MKKTPAQKKKLSDCILNQANISTKPTPFSFDFDSTYDDEVLFANLSKTSLILTTDDYALKIHAGYTMLVPCSNPIFSGNNLCGRWEEEPRKEHCGVFINLIKRGKG